MSVARALEVAAIASVGSGTLCHRYFEDALGMIDQFGFAHCTHLTPFGRRQGSIIRVNQAGFPLLAWQPGALILSRPAQALCQLEVS